MSVSKKDLFTTVYYPETDGEPMAETDAHRQLMVDLIESLKTFFAGKADVYVSGNLLLYYVPGDNQKSVAPDVFVVRGVGKRKRRIYKLWEEGRAPSVVIEVSSKETKKKDLGEKKDLYAQLGVREYFIFDPEYKLKPPFRAFRLSGDQYVELAVTGGRVRSDELGLELVNTGQILRLFDPQTGRILLTPEEEAEARLEAATQAEQAEERAEQAEERAALLAAKLRELGIDPDQI
ncbi:MAG: Uma2 family endonuclease [Blastocatellia bacterium]